MPKITDFAKPRLISSNTEITSIKGYKLIVMEESMQPTMQGEAVMNPNRENDSKVASPHFRGKSSSLIATKLSSSNIIILTKAFQFVEYSSAKRLQSYSEYPFFLQISTISAFSYSNIFLTSQSSLSSSFLMQAISALADTQSQHAISSAPATIAAMVIANKLDSGVLDETPLSRMMVVLTVPSTPPQMMDLRSYPTEMCCSSWFSESKRCSKVMSSVICNIIMWHYWRGQQPFSQQHLLQNFDILSDNLSSNFLIFKLNTAVGFKTQI